MHRRLRSARATCRLDEGARRQSFELQRSAVAQQTVAVEAQARHLRLYRRVLLVSGIVVAARVSLVLLRFV
jgi:hypothetical protein